MSKRRQPSADARNATIDAALFPPSFLRLLALVPSAVRRLHAGVADGHRVQRGEGGRFFFRGHREYRPGDDLKRIDWNVAARSGRTLVRQYDAEKDVSTEVWLDGSASMVPGGGHVTTVRTVALCCAIGLASGGRVRLGRLQEGAVRKLFDARDGKGMRTVLEILSAHTFEGRADLARALPLLQRQTKRGARLMLISDLLTRTHPGVLQGFAARSLRGAVIHLRTPVVAEAMLGQTVMASDVENGVQRRVRMDAATVARIAERSRTHADLWARHVRSIGLHYVPVSPDQPSEDVLRRLVLEVP